MTPSTQPQAAKHKPQPPKANSPVKAVAQPRPAGLSHEEMRHIIKIIG